MNEISKNFQVDGVGETVLHPLGLLLLLLCGVLLVVVPRKYATWPLIVLVCFVSGRQCVAIAGVNLYLIRVMVLFFGTARLVVKNELGKSPFTTLDWCVIGYGVLYWLTGAVNWGFSLAEIKNRTGNLIEMVGLYLLFRALIQTKEDGVSVIRGLALISIPICFFFVVEQFTGRNVFSIFGGVHEFTDIREGRLRSQGAFSHSIIAGVFWASFLPLMIYQAVVSKKQRYFYVLVCLCLCIIVVTTASSTPLLGMIAAFAGMALYPYRRFTRLALALGACMLVVLQVVMRGSVWGLIARIDLIGGNSAYHRYLLIDGFITHAHEWFVMGSRVGSAHWGHFTYDPANHYVVVGLLGGFPTLLMLFAIIGQSFLATERTTKRDPLLGWAIGMSIAVQCLCFFGISIWGQMHFCWSLLLALAGSMSLATMSEQRSVVVARPRQGASYPETFEQKGKSAGESFS